MADEDHDIDGDILDRIEERLEVPSEQRALRAVRARWEDLERERGEDVLCEVNGVPVLVREGDGRLRAPEGLEGIAAYFDSRGTPEQLYRSARNDLRRLRKRAREVVEARYESDSWERLKRAIGRLADEVDEDE